MPDEPADAIGRVVLSPDDDGSGRTGIPLSQGPFVFARSADASLQPRARITAPGPFDGHAVWNSPEPVSAASAI